MDKKRNSWERSSRVPFHFLIFSLRYSFKATALLNLFSFEPYSKVIDFCFCASVNYIIFLSNSLKYLCINSFHFFSSCPNHPLNVLLGAISFCHRSTLTLSLLNPRGQSRSANILKLLSYILSIFIANFEVLYEDWSSWIRNYLLFDLIKTSNLLIALVKIQNTE